MTERTLSQALTFTMDLCNKGFSQYDPSFYETISEVLREHSSDEEVAGMLRMCAAGPTLTSKRFAYPHIQDMARKRLEAAAAAS